MLPGGSMHPFGNEEAYSAQELFRFFCRNLCNGRWELARACLPRLCENQAALGLDVAQLLEAVASQPRHFLGDGPYSANCLAMICLHELEHLKGGALEGPLRLLHQDVEFRLLLDSCSCQIPADVIQNLYHCFQQTHCLTRSEQHDPDVHLSNESKAFLQNIIDQDSWIGHAIISSLNAEMSHGSIHHPALQQLFVDSILGHLVELRKSSNSDNPSDTSDCKVGEIRERLYSCVATLNLSAPTRTVDLERLFLELHDACHGAESILSETRLLSCLLRQGNNFLVKYYCAVVDEEHRKKSVHENAVFSAVEGDVAYGDLQEGEKMVLSLMSHPDRARTWKELYFYCIANGKHFLELIVMAALQLVKRGDLGTLGQLLSGELEPLCRLVLLLGWTHCSTPESARELLRTLHCDRGVHGDRLLANACNSLASQVDVLQWCIRKSSKNLSVHDLARHLHSQEQHSTLYQLHHLTDLLGLHEAEVLALLLKPMVTDTDQDAETSSELPTLDQQRNVALFHSFCAMKHAISALCLKHFPSRRPSISHESNTSQTVTNLCSSNQDVTEKDAERTTSSLEGPTSGEGCPSPLDDAETNLNSLDCPVEDFSTIEWHFEQCHSHLKQIAPPNLRLEVMENIFSLLFVTFEDLAGEGVGTESDSEEYVEDATFDQWAAESLESSVDILSCSPPDLDDQTSQTRAELQKMSLQSSTLSNKSPTSHGTSTETSAEIDAEIADTSQSNPQKVKAALKRFAFSLKRKSGFIVDEHFTHSILCLLEESLETLKDEGCPTQSTLQLVDSVVSSVSMDFFSHRLSRLSNYISEAHWRYRLIFANHFTGPHKGPDFTRELKRKRFKGKRSTQSQHKEWSECIKEAWNSDIPTSAAECSSGGSERTGQSRLNERSSLRQESRIIPLMLTPPESLLTACILQENYAQAQQVVAMFGLGSAQSLDELRFAEEYGARVAELQRLEVQAKAVLPARRVPSPNEPLDVLQSIATAAAAGVASTSVVGSVERLMTLVPDHFPLPPALAEAADAGVGAPGRDAALLRRRLAECPPPALVAFDLACTRSTSWKTCRTLLEVAERRLLAGTVAESRGKKGDHKASTGTSIRGFPTFLKQVSKIINHTQPSGVSDDADLSSHFNVSVSELLLAHPGPLSAEHMETQLVDRARADCMLLRIFEAVSTQNVQGDVVAHLLKNWAKAPSGDSESVRHLIKQLLKVMDPQEVLGQPTEPAPAYLHRLFDYLNVLSMIIIRSQGRETDSSANVKPTNTLVLLQKRPVDLLSQLLFEEQTLPSRLEVLIKEECPPLALNLRRVILDSCCRPLPLGGASPRVANATLAAQLEAMLHGAVASCLPAQLELLPLSSGQKAEDTGESSQSVCQYSLTAATLAYLKEVSPLLAMVACLTGDKRPGDKRKEKKNKKERPLEITSLRRELQHLMLNDFPVLHEYLSSTAALLGHPPILGLVTEGQTKGEDLCECWPGCDCCPLLLCGLHDERSAAVIARAFEVAMSAQDWARALKLLNRFGREDAEWDRLRDALLCCAAATDKEGWRFLLMMRGSEVRARVALWGLERWPAEQCLDLLELCISQGDTAPHLQEQLKLKHREITLYSTIQNFSILENCTSWTDVVKESIQDPARVLEGLLKVKKFAVCREWAQLYTVGADCLLKIVEEEVAHLLEKGDTEHAQHLLESLGEVQTCQSVCERLLEQFRSVTASHFLSDYLSTHFLPSMSPEQRKLTQTIWIGTQLLLDLPQSVHVHYQELVSAPMLLLEQLLMNMRVNWAEGAVRTLRTLLIGRFVDITSEDVDVLLSTYASKALEFPYVSQRSRSRQDSNGSTPDSGMSKFGSSPEATKSGSQASDKDGSSPDGSVGSIPGPRTSTPVERRASRAVRTNSWSPPATVPTKNDWVLDEKARVCMACQQETFSMFNRRHHCRRCGRVVCTSCSSRTMVVDTYNSGPVRVCSQCYDYFQSDGPTEGESPIEGEPGQEEVADSPLQIVLQAGEDNVWSMSLNTSTSQRIREEFYYDQAPSASLCVALLKLHSNVVQCSHQLIEHCRELSLTLNEPEVDSVLVIGIMRNLLFNAKMMFSSAGHSQDLGVCDSYISRVDVLKILVSASYRLIPSLYDILRPSAVTRLRDQLIQDERYLLAIEVSTKCGLDTSGVWSFWGMACMRAGCLSSAREKFSRCMRPPPDLNQTSMGSIVLQEVVQHLESTMPGSLSMDDDVLASLNELELLLKVEGSPVAAPHSPKAPPRDTRLEECLFYLQHYGTYLSLVSFYGRHGRYHEALTFLLEKNCAEHVFVEGLFVPCLGKGQLDVLEKHLEELDPSLQRWRKYLIAACKSMDNKNMPNVLYALQCFMKDNVRAAMTCINFFRKGANSYAELATRLDFLERAKNHLNVALSEQQVKAPTSGPAASRILPGSSSTPSQNAPFTLKMSKIELSRNIRRIELQVEVTRFLSQYDTARARPPPTLFDDNNVKSEVACLLMLSGGNVEVGFGNAFRIIQEFQLPALTVYTRVARRLVEERQLHEVETLLRNVSESGSADPNDCDSIALDTVRAVAAATAAQPGTGQLQAKEIENLIMKIKNNSAKIEAHLLCGKLRAAYLVAVKLPGRDASRWVETIRKRAAELEQAVMVELCERWLSTHGDTAPPPGQSKT
ncbi:zinc finger FYVE domain-containing protein 26 isoform X2 [Lampetra fluviatilis]